MAATQAAVLLRSCRTCWLCNPAEMRKCALRGEKPLLVADTALLPSSFTKGRIVDLEFAEMLERVLIGLPESLSSQVGMGCGAGASAGFHIGDGCWQTRRCLLLPPVV